MIIDLNFQMEKQGRRKISSGILMRISLLHAHQTASKELIWKGKRYVLQLDPYWSSSYSHIKDREKINLQLLLLTFFDLNVNVV